MKNVSLSTNNIDMEFSAHDTLLE